ncbi:MAG TPA: hypothetical protein VMW18_00250 [Candidatus Binatia bacterium]|nr:hypothetical protein [Candidatus Binatia bacterium]
MKYVVWGIAALVVIVAVIIGGGYVWITHHEVDFKDAQTAANFKESFNTNCLAIFQKRAGKNGATPSQDDLDKVDQACSCARDGIVEALARREPLTVVELTSVMQGDPEIKGITNACAAQFGIATP